MGEPARISEFDESVVEDGAADFDAAGKPVPVARFVYDLNKLPLCCICSRKGFTRNVAQNPDGSLTGLCATHNAFETEFRRELRQRAKMGKIDEDTVKEVRANVVARFTTGRPR